jgi:PAS domain S-box-containing protein
MFQALFRPAIAAMNRMNFMVKFVFIGLLLLLPFAYVTHVMVKGSDKQIVFNQKEVYGIDYITPAAQLLSKLQDSRTCSAALLAGDDSFRADLDRNAKDIAALLPVIDRVDEQYREEFKTDDGRAPCTERWVQIKSTWTSVQRRTFKSEAESYAAYSELCDLVTDWILNYAANYSNLILDPDLDSYWLMDAFVGKLPQITEDLSQACALGIALGSRPDGASMETTSEERLAIHALYVDAVKSLKSFQDVNLKTAYDYNNTKSKTLQGRLEPLVRTSSLLTTDYLETLKNQLVKGAGQRRSLRDQVEASRKAMAAGYALYERVGPELRNLIDARVRSYQGDKTLGVIAAESATFLHVYLFIAFYLAIHASVTRISGFTKRMIEGTREHFKLDSRDELARVAESYNQINATLVETRDLKALLESRTGELQASEERFRTLASRAPVGIYMTDAAGDCLYVNERWCTMSAMTSEEARGKGWIRAVHPDDRERVSREWYAAAGARKDFASEYRFGTPQGIVWLSGNAVTLRDRSGAITGFLGSVTDISEQKRVERLKNEFISTVSHELRTPLTSIRGALGLIAGGVAGALPVKAKSMVDIAKKNCERLVRLVSDILDIEKIESGKMTFDIRPVEFAPILDQSVEANRTYAQSMGVTIDLDNAPAGVRVLADADRLMQVVTNLLSNAAKFSPAGRSVQVRVAAYGDNLRVSVKDEGPGIPDEFRSRIFQKFAQADASDGRAKQGTGLGLSICRAIVERMGGRIGFETGRGLGTTFYFDIPLQGLPLKSSTAPRPGRPAVLVCEDDGDVATILRGILEGAGYNIDLATTATQAKELLKNNRYVGMTLDLALPEQDGISLLRDLREDAATRHLPVVIVSAYMEEGRKAINGDAFGILDWLEKPIDEARLKRALARTTAFFDGRKPRILHVEDDADIAEVVRVSLGDRAEVIQADTLAAARERVRHEKFDLLILDIGLPDGSGLELLPVLRGTPYASTPVVIFSAQEVSPKTSRHVQAALVKSKATPEELMVTISAILGNPIYADHPAPAPVA